MGCRHRVRSIHTTSCKERTGKMKRFKEYIVEVPQDPEIGDREGSQPKKNYAGDMAKSTKQSRARHFDKKKKGPAPGDASAKTKPSKHTKKYDQMFGEDSVKKVTSGEFAGRYMVKYIWNRRKETGIFDTKADAIKHAQVIRKTKGAKLDEKIEGLKNKAEKTGISYGILKQVYDRGMAAYKSGHRPGATAQQWAFARVNSFVTKSKGTWGGADKDLAAKVRG